MNKIKQAFEDSKPFTKDNPRGYAIMSRLVYMAALVMAVITITKLFL